MSIDDRQIDNAKRALHRRQLVEIVQDHQPLLATLQLDDDAHPLTITLVANVADSFNAFFVAEFGDLLYQTRFVYLVGYFRHHDHIAIFTLPFDGRPSAHGELATARSIGLPYSATSGDDSGSGKVRAGNSLMDFIETGIRMIDEMNHGLGDFSEIVRRHVRGHANGNPA